MHVIIINESIKKALIRSRRVLSRYVPQIGSSTWAGQVSQEGLDDLHAKLLAAGVSKATAICCHRILSRTRTAVEWTVGSRASFDAEGRYAFRQTAARAAPTPPREKLSRERFTAALLRLAALFHDTGKANLAFKKKLKTGSGAETVRHDLLSFMVLAESLWTSNVTDSSWLELLASSPAQGCASVSGGKLLPSDSKWVARITQALASDRGSLVSKAELETLSTRAPGLMTVLWLVLTHHRLPAGDDMGEQLDPRRHLNKQSLEPGAHPIAPLAECLAVAPGTPPWEDPSWLAAVSMAAKQALEALPGVEAAGPVPPFFWVHLAAHQLRPALVLSDHLGSKQSERTLAKSDPLAKERIFANLFDKTHYGDSLAAHELKVARLTRSVRNLVYAKMPTTALPDNSLALKRKVATPFQWQLDLEDRCSEARGKGPTFVSIVAETGAGKTLAAVRAASALNANALRVTFALGLRSLTWQSAMAMLQDARVPKADLTVAVGQPETLGLDEKARDLQIEVKGGTLSGAAEPRLKFGSESSEGAELCAELSAGTGDSSWVETLCTAHEAAELWGQKTLTLLSSPVVACTADHLVASVSLLKGGDAKLFLRQATSDLILDEIDGYSAADLQSIAKLAFAAGSYGKNVILMSATMSPDVQAGLHRAWQQGVELFCAFHEKPLQFCSIFSSNTAPSVLLNTPSESVVEAQWVAYVSSVAAAYASKALTEQLRKLKVIPLTATTRDGAQEELVRASMTLHRSHCLPDPATGARVSVGFIRFNTAKSAWKMAQYLAERQSGPDEPVIKFVSYHSKFPRSYLGVLDATLGQLTNRKAPDEFFKTPALRTVLDTHSSPDVLVVVCTTTLMETGRDFDFDWCVLEPRSVRGEVQAIGRVRRHRRSGVVAVANVALLDRPLRFLETPDGALWGRPGVEDALPGLRVTFSLPSAFASRGIAMAGPALAPAAVPAPPVRHRPPPRTSPATGGVILANDALPLASWAAAFDAQLCLLPTRSYALNRIGFLEQAIQNLHLGRQATWSANAELPPSVSFYFNSWAPFNAVHAQLTRFRGATEATTLFIPTTTGVTFWDFEEGRALKNLSATLQSSPARNALIPDLAAQADKLKGTSPHLVGCSLRCAAGRGSSTSLVWDPLLGFLEGQLPA